MPVLLSMHGTKLHLNQGNLALVAVRNAHKYVWGISYLPNFVSKLIKRNRTHILTQEVTVHGHFHKKRQSSPECPQYNRKKLDFFHYGNAPRAALPTARSCADGKISRPSAQGPFRPDQANR
jgi:hypothetical protein